MKLLNALLIAKDCDLTDVGEAIYNIQIHAGNLFNYGEEKIEYDELIEDYKNARLTYGIFFDMPIVDALEKLEV